MSVMNAMAGQRQNFSRPQVPNLSKKVLLLCDNIFISVWRWITEPDSRELRGGGTANASTASAAGAAGGGANPGARAARGARDPGLGRSGHVSGAGAGGDGGIAGTGRNARVLGSATAADGAKDQVR